MEQRKSLEYYTWVVWTYLSTQKCIFQILLLITFKISFHFHLKSVFKSGYIINNISN